MTYKKYTKPVIGFLLSGAILIGVGTYAWVVSKDDSVKVGSYSNVNYAPSDFTPQINGATPMVSFNLNDLSDFKYLDNIAYLSFDKDVDHIGNAPSFVRVPFHVEAIQNTNIGYSNSLPLSYKSNDNFGLLSYNFNMDALDGNWVLGEDGYFYLLDIVKPGKGSLNLVKPDQRDKFVSVGFFNQEIDSEVKSIYGDDDITFTTGTSLEAVGISTIEDITNMFFGGVVPESGVLKEVYDYYVSVLN